MAEYPDFDTAVRSYRAADAVMANPGQAVPGMMAGRGAATDPAPPAPAANPASGASAEQQDTELLRKATQDAYDAYPRDCSHAVWVVLRRLVNPDEEYRDANALIKHLDSDGSGWREVTMEEAARVANTGQVAIAGRPEPSGHGHVEVLLPGPNKSAGGFDNIPPSRKTFPPVMSGSSTGYAGAMSRNGERTVRDGWKSGEWPGVKYWVRK